MACCGKDAVEIDEKLLHAAVTLVIKDDGFKLDTFPAAKSRELVTAYLQWSSMSRSAVAHDTFLFKVWKDALDITTRH